VTTPYIVAVGGTLRANSTTERAMRHVLAAAERAGAKTRLISGASLQLPLYQPDNPERSSGARELVAELALADGIVLGSPGYHGSISGLVKNALDYAEDLRSDVRPYFSGRAVGCIATAGGWPTPAGAAINSSDKTFDENGACIAPRVAQMLDSIAGEVLSFARLSSAR
jgi:FMN reductase